MLAPEPAISEFTLPALDVRALTRRFMLPTSTRSPTGCGGASA